jgi:L-fuconolactonase
MIDAHQHFWQFNHERDTWMDGESMACLRRDYMPQHLLPLLERHGFTGCVAVQADQSEEETQFLLNLADQFSSIKAVVGWVDLCSPLLYRHLEHWEMSAKLVGFRHILQSEKPEFMLQPTFVEGLKTIGNFGFTYDLLVFPSHLEAANCLLQKIENQLVVIDHLAKPHVKNGDISGWEHTLRQLARYDNVYCKLSGLVTEADWQQWTYPQLEPYMEVALSAFGAHRLMYGSDWPVCLLAAEYEQQLSVINQFIHRLSPTEQAAIMGETAVHFYQIST